MKYLTLLPLLLMMGCATVGTQQPVNEAVPPVVNDCATIQGVLQHVKDRHCTLGVAADQFIPSLCNTDALDSVCREIFNSQGVNVLQQGSGNYVLTGNLMEIIGTANQQCGRVVFSSTGNMVTIFPVVNNGELPNGCAAAPQ
jgi:hypothetical protein